MKKYKTFLPVGAALMLFIVAQFFIVRQIWVQKDEVFKLKYRSGSQEAIDNMMIKSGDSGFDYAYNMIDYISSSYIENSKMISSQEDSLKFRESVNINISKILSEYEVLSGYLSSHFDNLGLDKEFKHLIFVNDIYLLDFYNKIHVYQASNHEIKKQKALGHVLVNSFTSEGNNYRLSFDYYIDLANKRKIILRDIGITLLLSFSSLMILAAIFIGTLRNYLEEKRLSSLKTDFINNMTHELKTPLSTITVAGKTLKLEEILKSREKILDTARLISKQSVHLNKLINLILEISMWERSQFQVDKKETNVEELLKEVSEGFRNGCGEKCNLTENYSLNGLTANIDIVYFTTMINNLLHNAIKYSGESPAISINAKANEVLKIDIADNGMGISKNDQKHIFEKFYRVSTGNIHKTKGLGLGLYYVKKIAEAHGGDVKVSSKKGKGSVFTIIIPLK